MQSRQPAILQEGEKRQEAPCIPLHGSPWPHGTAPAAKEAGKGPPSGQACAQQPWERFEDKAETRRSADGQDPVAIPLFPQGAPSLVVIKKT